MLQLSPKYARIMMPPARLLNQINKIRETQLQIDPSSFVITTQRLLKSHLLLAQGGGFGQLLWPCLLDYQLREFHLSTVVSVRLSNLPGLYRPFLPFEMGDVFIEIPFQKPPKTSENSKQVFTLFSLLAMMTLVCVHAFCPLERMDPPE